MNETTETMTYPNAPEGNHNDKANTIPLEPNKKDEIAATISPVNNNAGEQISSDGQKPTTPPEDVDLGTPYQPSHAGMTGDDLMAEHVGEIPKAENKFSLASLKSKSDDTVPKSNTTPGAVRVSKPNDDTFVRTSFDSEEWAAFDFIELKTDQKLYLLTPGIMAEIAALNEKEAQLVIKTVKKRLIYSVTRIGEPFLWPITVLDRDNDWIDSANTCADAAKECWIRLVSNQSTKSYDYVTSPLDSDPKWPAMTYEEAILKAFERKVIDSMEHDVIKKLLGED